MDDADFFTYLLAIFTVSLESCLITVLAHLLISLLLCYLVFQIFKWNLDFNTLSDVWCVASKDFYFLLLASLHLSSLVGEAFGFNAIPFVNSWFYSQATRILSDRLCLFLYPCLQVFFSRSFRVLGYILRFSIQVDLVSDLEPVYSSTCGHPLFLTAFVREAVFSPVCAIGIFVKCQFAMVTWTYLHAFLSFYPGVCICASTMMFLLLWFYSIEVGNEC